MKTAKGNSYSTLLNMAIADNKMVVIIPVQQNSVGDISLEYVDKAIPFISERIQTEKKPGVTFTKELQRIEHHRDQLRDAYMALWQCYMTAITPDKKRASPIDKARYDMLQTMTDKMLRDFTAVYLKGAELDYVLPDEKEQLIIATVEAMRS